MQTECMIHSGVPVLSEQTRYQDLIHKISPMNSLLIVATTMLT